MKAITFRKPSIALIILVVLVALLAIPSTAVQAAHSVTVTLDPVASDASEDPVAYTLTVQNDIGSADDIVEVKLDIPPAGSGGSNFLVSAVNNPTGWTNTTTSDIFNRVDVITWSTSTNAIGANSTGTFTFTANTPIATNFYNWEVTTKDSQGTTVLTVVTTEIEVDGPILLSVGWNDANGINGIDADDLLVFTFDEAIDQSTITDANINTVLAPSGGNYGSAPTLLSWTNAGTVLTITLAGSPSVLSGANVDPTGAVTDIAGNPDATPSAAATGTYTVTTDFASIGATDIVTVGGIDKIEGGTDWDKITSAIATATSLAAAINGISSVTAASSGTTLVTVTAAEPGVDGNSIDTTTDVVDGLTVAQATLAGGLGPNITEADPPSLTGIAFNNVDGPNETGFSESDTIVFTFDEAVNVTADPDQLDTLLPLSAGSWGTVAGNLAVAGTGTSTFTVTLGNDFTFVSGVTVDPADTVTDLAGNADATGAGVAITDAIEPKLLTIAFTNNDLPNTGITAGDDVAFAFSETMDTSTITAANLGTALPLSEGLYGTGATAVWSGDDKILTVTLGAGTTIVSGATVNPDATVTDLAGNSDATTGSGIAILDDVAPTLLSVTWTDLNPSGDIDAGDTLAFLFSESMNEGTVSGTGAQLDTDLVPSGGDSYGSDHTLNWNSTSTLLTVTLAGTPTVVSGATVNPAAAVRDVAGNDDNTISAPEIVQVTITLTVDNATVKKGDTVLVTVNITEVENFDAANYSIAFNPNVLSFNPPDEGSADGLIGVIVIPVVQTAVVTGTAVEGGGADLPTGFADDDPVSVVTVVQNIGPPGGATGAGTLAVLSFTFIGNSGESTVITLVGETAGPVLIDTDASGSGDALVNPVTLSDTAAITISPNLSNTSVSSPFLLGDADGNGDVLPTDITVIELAVAAGLVVYGGIPGVTGEATPGADANEDDAINALDITEVELLTLS